MTLTLTKRTISEEVMNEYLSRANDSGLKIRYAQSVVTEFVELIKEHILEFNRVCIIGYGYLVPVNKPGGRPVRNPKTMEELPMPDSCTVKVTKNPVHRNATRRKICSSRLTSELVDRIKAKELNSPYEFSPEIMADVVVRTFAKTLRLTAESDTRAEIRGLGTFNSKMRDSYNARNPMTGESVEVEERRKKHYKVSSKLRRELTERYIAS